MITKLFEKFLILIYPEKCPFCNKIINHNDICCEECYKEISETGKVQILTIESIKKDIRCFSSVIYKNNISKAIWRFKFHGYKNYDKHFAMLMEQTIKKYFNNNYFDIITSVPLGMRKKFFRGYNQSKLLGIKLSESLRIPYSNLLKKTKNNNIQHFLKAEERAKNVLGVYSINNNKKDLIQNKTLLLCDDIVTTGSTLKECAKTLLKAGAKEVVCITIAWA